MNKYRVAILADIHGNVGAMEAVLAHLPQHSPDLCVLAGDLFENGPHPAQVLERVCALKYPSIIGNTDDDLLNMDSDWPAAVWAREQVGPAGLEYLRGLPLTYRVTPPGGSTAEDDLLIVHSTPRSNTDLLIQTLQPGSTSFTTLTPPEEAQQMLAGVRAGLIVYGHIHYFSAGEVNGQRVSSIGSVGFPFDRDPRAAYALADWDGERWSITPQRVTYDYEQAARDVERSGQPAPQRYARMIRESSWLPAE